MNEIKIFNNEKFGDVRIAIINNEPLFCLADVCNVVGLTNPSSVKSRLDDDEVQLLDLNALNGIQEEKIGNSMATFINESGFYSVLLFSSSPSVKPFRKWITSEILPSVRKTGGFISTYTDDTPELIMARALQVADATIKNYQFKIQSQQKKIEEDAPKVLFADAVSISENSILIAELARILNQKGIIIGQNRLFELMRKNGYLCCKGDYYNLPTQKAMNMNLFEVKKNTINKPDGTVLTSTTTKVTGKGEIYFVNKFLNQ